MAQLRALLTLAALAISLVACDRGQEPIPPVETEIRIAPSRVAVFAKAVISDVEVTLDRTWMVEDDYGPGLRAIGSVSNQSAEALSGLELSLTLEQPEGVGVGGHLVHVFLASPLASQASEVVMIDFPMLSAVDLGQNVTTKVTVLKKLDGPPPDGAAIVTGRSEAEPYRATAAELRERTDVDRAEESVSDMGLEEETDGDEVPAAGDGS